MNCMRKDSFKGKTVVISGSGNVAIFATEKAVQLGAKVVALSDSAGYIYDKDGIRLDIVKDIKLERRARISEYVKEVPQRSITKAAPAFGRFPVTLLCRALPRTSWMRQVQKRWLPMAVRWYVKVQICLLRRKLWNISLLTVFCTAG